MNALNLSRAMMHALDPSANVSTTKECLQRTSNHHTMQATHTSLCTQIELEFGFVPRNVISDLGDIGNWKSRANAIDALLKVLKEEDNKAAVIGGLPKFVGFLMTLVADPNFKIAISSLQILGELINKVGKDIGPHLR